MSTVASTTATTTTTTTTAPAPAADATLVAQMQKRLESIAAEKEANATIGKKLDEKLRVAFKNPPRRPNMTVDAIKDAIAAKDLQQTTTSLSNAEERLLLRDLQQLNDKLGQWREFDTFQAWVDATRDERNARFQKNKDFETQLAQLTAALKKLKVAAAVGANVADFVTLELSVPEDRMGLVIGKQFATLRQIEKDCGALLEVDNKANIVRITSAPANAAAAKDAVENISLATTHSIGLHPDTVKVLLMHKSTHLHGLEQRLGLKIDINRSDGILTTSAAPAKAKELDKAIKELASARTEVQLPAEVVPKLIGKKGETINQLMADTGSLIDIDKVTNAVRLCGTAESVAAAKAFVLALIDEQSQRELVIAASDTTVFPPDFDSVAFDFFVEFLMANKAKQLRTLRAAASDAKVQVSKADKRVVVSGNKKQLAAAPDALRARVREFADHHWVYEVTDSYLLSLIIGKKGSTIKQIENEFASGNVRIDIQGTHVCVLGTTAESIDGAKSKILAVVDANQRAFCLTSQYVVTVLLTNKRAKLQEIETASGCKLNLPPPPATSGSSSSDQVKINLTGSLDAITTAKRLLEDVAEAHNVRYVPLDDDEIPTVIGKKGETISQLETSSGAKIRVLKAADGAPAELEMLGTEAQLADAQAALDALLQTQHRQLLQLDAFAAACVIGKKGERIKALRAEHPDASVDAFPNRGQVRIKATSPEALAACTDAVLTMLRETLVVESVRVPTPVAATPTPAPATTGVKAAAAYGASRTTSNTAKPVSVSTSTKSTGSNNSTNSNSSGPPPNFLTVLKKHEAIAMRLQELEAEGGENMKVTIQDDGRTAKIRGPALGVGALKRFLEMIVASETLFVETIELPALAFANVLLAKGAEVDGKLNDNALRICRLTGCELRVKRSTTSKDAGAIRIEGTNASKVYEAKSSVESVLQFYFSDHFATLRDLPHAVVPRLYELLPTLRATHRVVFSLSAKSSLSVFTDSPQTTAAVVKRLEREIAAWRALHVELPVAAWLVPLLVGKSGETIKKLSAESSGAKFDLSPAPSATSSAANTNSTPRVLTVSARDDEALTRAVANVQQLIAHHENLTSTVHVPRAKLDLALSARRDASSGVHIHVLDSTNAKDSTQDSNTTAKDAAELTVVVYGADFDARERVVEKIEHLLATCAVERIVLPATLSPSVTSAVIGALIGKSGANIRALQNEFPGVAIDIERRDSSISLKGPTDAVRQVQRVMEDKVEELLRAQEQRSARFKDVDADNVVDADAAAKTSKNAKAATAAPTSSGSASVDGDENGADENSQPRSNRPHVPVGAPPSMLVTKLDKNQRRRMRKRAELEKQSDVLSMIMSGSSATTADAATTIPTTKSTTLTTTTKTTKSTTAKNATTDASGYYHSNSGYSLRL